MIAEEILAAPELMFIECANVLWTMARRGRLAREFASEALASIHSIPIRSVPIRPNAAAAHAIALELDRSAYDALYLAVALSEHATLVTADAKFAAAVRAHPVYRSSLMLLSA